MAKRGIVDPGKAQRNKLIVVSHKSGMTLTEIARITGLSVERVRQVVGKAQRLEQKRRAAEILKSEGA